MPRSINWLPWCQDTFSKAALDNKPILMYLTAHWCSWGAIMDDTTFQDAQVVNLVEDSFIPIKVNVDKYPHVADRYHFGGYPSVVILTSEGQILKGENYLSEELMKGTLEDVLKKYNGWKIIFSAKKKKHNLGKIKPNSIALKQGNFLPLSIFEVNEIIANAYDQEFGGFIISHQKIKFPLPEIHDYLLLYAENNPGSAEEMMVRHSLDAIWAGEVYDRERGGFFRLCEGKDWTLPHAEKLLDHNANLIRNYLTAYEKLGWGEYEVLIRDSISFFISELFNEETQVFGGSKIGKKVDKTPFTNWNSIMSSSLLLAYRVLGDQEYLDLALKVIESLWSRCYRLGRGMSHYYLNGPAEVELFSDQIKYIEALYDAFSLTEDKVYLHRMDLLMRSLEKNYQLPEGNFSDIPLTEKNLGYLCIPLVPFVENIDMARVYIKMSRLMGSNYAEKARHILESLSPMIRENPIFAAKYGQALIEMDNYWVKNRVYNN
ncbi:MAG: DUF255 domain-containing protein [Bacillota bacterium]|jgi:uncharacterized protein YyaL (SSP411 family)